MSTLNVAAIQDVDAGGPKATLPTSGGSNFTLGPNWGALEFVSSSNFTTATTKAVEPPFVAGYDYQIEAEYFLPTDDTELLWMRLKDGSYQSDATDYAWAWGTPSSAGTGDASDAKIIVSGYSNGFINTTAAGLSNKITLCFADPAGTNDKTQVTWWGGMAHSDATPLGTALVGIGQYITNTNAITGMQLLWSGGSTFQAAGRVVTYRRRRS